MSGLELQELRLRWTVKLNTTPPLVSPSFTFQDRRWSLWLFKGHCEGVYCLYLQKDSNSRPNPFDVSVVVEVGEMGRIAEELSENKRCTNDNRVSSGMTRWRIWDNAFMDFERWGPEFLRDGGCLRFLVGIRDGDATPADSCPLCLSPPAAYQTVSPRGVPCLESLSEDFSNILDQSTDPDVEFLCAGQCTKAHAVIVCARSPVIAATLASNMVEGRTRVVEIPDMEPDVFQHFLRYLYTGTLPELTGELALNLYEAGDRYAVLGLARKSSQYLKEHL